MQRLTLELPNSLLSRLEQQAARQDRRVEELIVEHLSNGTDQKAQAQDSRLDQFYAQGELAVAGPLSEAIIEERRRGH